MRRIEWWLGILFLVAFGANIWGHWGYLVARYQTWPYDIYYILLYIGVIIWIARRLR